MKIQDLQIFLKRLTEKEKHYKAFPDYVPSYYCDLETETTKDNKVIYSFTFNEKIKNLRDKDMCPPTSDFLVIRQNRYENIPLHRHDFIEVSIIYQGQATVMIQDKEITMQKGNVCIFDTNVPHRISTLGEDNILLNLIMDKTYFNASVLKRLSNFDIISDFLLNVVMGNQKKDHYIFFQNNNNQLFFSLLENLLCEYYDPSFHVGVVLDSYITLIFSQLLKNYLADLPESHRMSNKRYSGEIIQYISDNYNTCSLNSVSEKFNLHPNYLSRYIKKSTGFSYKSLVQRQRINKACFLLLNTDLTVEQISHEVGYKNCDFFYKQFKLHHNTSPKKYKINNGSKFKMACTCK